MKPPKMTMILHLIKQQPQFTMLHNIIQSLGLRLLKRRNNIPLLPQNKPLIENIINRRRHEQLINIRKTRIYPIQLLLHTNPQRLQRIQTPHRARRTPQPVLPTYLTPMTPPIVSVHNVPGAHHSNETKARTPSSDRDGTVIGEKRRGGKKNGEDRPETVFVFLRVVNVRGFVGDEEVEGVEEGENTGAEYGGYGEECEG
mmetsp:Transcript_11744/g.14602  ORF Transcript_11744/g.14602 Transcript_11744/m.14602 type:complete len:200 (+) Transcript_11744:3312-3911(+)